MENSLSALTDKLASMAGLVSFSGLFGGGRELAPIGNPNGLSQFDQPFTFTVGDAPGPVRIDAGIVLKVAATPWAVGTIDLEMSVLSIGFVLKPNSQVVGQARIALLLNRYHSLVPRSWRKSLDAASRCHCC
jgi:hypothetical protein